MISQRVLYLKDPPKIIFLKHVQHVEFDATKNMTRLFIASRPEPIEIAARDALGAKRLFYDILKDARADNVILEY
jgi:hypothetical protein